MSVTNFDRAAFRAQRRSGADWARENAAYERNFKKLREQPSWMRHPRDDDTLFRWIVACLIGVIFCIAIAAYLSRVRADAKHEAWARQTIEACRSDGKTPVVVRDAAEKVLAVRCEK